MLTNQISPESHNLKISNTSSPPEDYLSLFFMLSTQFEVSNFVVFNNIKNKDLIAVLYN